MAYSSSATSHTKYIVFLCLLLISLLKDVAAQPMANNAPQIKYDIFVSFRGKNVRNGILSHLVEAFHRKQIYAFVDDKLERGEEIWSSLVEAIEGSFISLILFSEDYASSRWCLEELVKVLECREKYGQIVIPVFYNVDPTNVRHQKGSYEIALAQHEKRYNLSKVQSWRHALSKSANLSGIKSSYFRNDAELLEEIIKLVLMKLNKHSSNSKGLVGIDKPIALLESLLSQESKEVFVIGIWGMGGIGKTTIAEEIYNKLCFEYEGCSFLANVREESRRHGMISLKEKFFSTLLVEDVKLNTETGLPNYIERKIGRKKFLIVLDDVNDSDQLEKLLGTRDWFGLGSRVIVTTRNKQVLVAFQVDYIYEVGVLNSREALQLFKLNAFDQSHVEMEYFDLSKRVVNYAKGIPLVLKVLGHLLRGKDKKVWESQLDKLKKMPSKKVINIIRLSYDDLDYEEQKIFLDLACFFNGLNLKVSYIKILLDDKRSDSSVVAVLERLRDLALITISKDKLVFVHDIVQQMGWEIVHQESRENPGSRSRLGDPDDIYEVLKNDKGTESIRSIRMHLPGLKMLKLSPHIFANMIKLQFLDFHCEYNEDCVDIFPQGIQYLPAELKYLRWMNYPLKSLPEIFFTEKLVILDLSYSQVDKLWHQVRNLVNLKEVEPHDSTLLKDISDATNHELDLHVHGQLANVYPSVFSLGKLEKLDLNHTFLTNLTSATHLSTLSYLEFGFCRMELLRYKDMIELDSYFGLQSNLQILHLRGSGIESLPLSIKNLRRLRYLDVSYCRGLQTLPELPSSLEALLATECLSLKTVLFPSVTEQFKENRKRVEFWNCFNLDEPSLIAIGLNAQINVMKFAYQHLSASKYSNVEYYNDYNYYHDSYQATYLYPGKRVPEWLDYKTTEDHILIDLSSVPRSSPLGFVFCFIVGKDPLIGLRLKFILSISDDDEAEDNEDSVEIYMSRAFVKIASDHVCVWYDQWCSYYLNSRAKNHPRFRIKVTARFASKDLGGSPRHVVLKGFGVSLMNTLTYHNFIQQMEVRDSKCLDFI